MRSSSTSTTPIVEKIDNIERRIIDGKVTLVDDEGKSLEKIDSSGDHDSEDEVESVDNEMSSFLSSKKSGLWYYVIQAIYGSKGFLDNTFRSSSYGSAWIGILKAVANLKFKGVDLLGYCKIVLGNGQSTQFWHDIWLDNMALKVKFPRLYQLENHKDATVANKLHCPGLTSTFRRTPRSDIEGQQFSKLTHLISLVSLSPSSDRWSWTLNGTGDFSMKSVREWIDSQVLPSSSPSSSWSKFIPIKVNVFLWRMFLDRLPTRPNLVNRGLIIPCIICPICGAAAESRNHLFFGCSKPQVKKPPKINPGSLLLFFMVAYVEV
uniref:RNA-directed DNA polymerase, eukaryota n=1 Tax=Tanacetum cinerariifolium TaxID=118510 RepID=A0A699GXU9_TANCI|nr:RNA-directed DNA polymerase, eukaryota [Tanacetum cinerariifolium]